jgi:hypothetical protein
MKSVERCLRLWIIFVTLFLAGFYARAEEEGDILMIDTNNAVTEVEAIRSFLKSEQKQGRELNTHLVLIPSEERVPMETRKQIFTIYETEIDSKLENFETNCSWDVTQKNPARKTQCEQTLARTNEARQRAADLLLKFSTRPAPTSERLVFKDVLEDIQAAFRGPYHFSRVLISGHHYPHQNEAPNDPQMVGGIFISGFTWPMARDALNGGMATRDVRSLIMLGCWTGRESSFAGAWDQVLPQAPFRSGFVGTAPAKTNATDVRILTSLLANEKQVGQSRTEEELRKSYSKIDSADRQIAVRVGNMYIAPGKFKRLP